LFYSFYVFDVVFNFFLIVLRRCTLILMKKLFMNSVCVQALMQYA